MHYDFLGDSITEQQMYTTLVESYVLTRFPSWNVTFRNVGWAGDTAWLCARGWENNNIEDKDFNHNLARDVLSLKPVVVLVAYGMNDARGKDAHLSSYVRYQKSLAERIRLAGSRVIYVSPSPEEAFEKDQPAGSAYNDWLRRYTEVLKGIADEGNLPFIDHLNSPQILYTRIAA